MPKNKVHFFLAAEYLIENSYVTYEDFKEKFCKGDNKKYDDGIYKGMVRSNLIKNSNECMILTPEGLSAYLAIYTLRQDKKLAKRAFAISIIAIFISILAIAVGWYIATLPNN